MQEKTKKTAEVRQNVDTPPWETPDLWETLAAETRPIFLYGMGNGADKLLDRCAARGIPICGVFASDRFVRGQSFRGMRVMTYGGITAQYPDSLVLLAFGTRDKETLAAIAAVAREHPLYVPDMPVSGEEWFDRAFAAAHREEILAAEVLFSDKLSVNLYRELIRCKLSGSFSDLVNACTAEEDRPTFSFGQDECFVDAGAYNGDTAEAFLNRHPACRRLLLIEPDPRTFRVLSAAVGKDESGREYLLRNVAAGSGAGSVCFRAGGNRNSAAAERGGAKTTQIPVAAIDTLAAGLSVGCIKYDVEGMEAEALIGSAGTIARTRPVLRVSVYHRSEDLFRLPFLCKRLLPESRLFLRRRRCVPAWETDLYVIPQERSILHG